MFEDSILMLGCLGRWPEIGFRPSWSNFLFVIFFFFLLFDVYNRYALVSLFLHLRFDGQFAKVGE
jgi:hypothetical protein